MTDQPFTPTVELAKQFRDAVIKRDIATLNRLVNAYRAMYERLLGYIDALILRLEMEGEGYAMTAGQVQQLAQYGRLLEAIERELTQYNGFMKTEISTEAAAAIQQATRDARLIVASATSEAGVVVAGFSELNPKVIETLLGFLEPTGPLMTRLTSLSGSTVERITNTIITSVGLGKNPRTLAALLKKDLGFTLTDALRNARTAQLYSYREATRANYIANSNIIGGWVWNSVLDDKRTCMSCVAMHGTEHGLDETLNDHDNGLCFMTPLLKGYRNTVQSGEDWFNSQDEATQRAFMGKGKYAAWKDGKFDFGALSREQDHIVWDKIRSETPLKDLVNE